MTIKEIAKLCGVSRGTVDRVLNKRGHVKPEVEALILQTIQEQGYTKNIAGRALTLKRAAPVIGVILCSEGNPFFDDVIAGLRKAERELLAHYDATVLLKTMRGHEVKRQLELLAQLEGQIAALIIQPINDRRIERKLAQFKDEGIPTVTINTDIADSCRCCYVGSDYEMGGAVAAGMMALVTGGQGKLGIVKGVDTLMGHVLRLKGFEEHLREIAPDMTIVAHDNAMDDPLRAYRVTREMLARHPEIDAIFVLAAGSYEVCTAVIDAGRENDMRVVAYDDVPSTREMMRRGLIRAVVCQQPVEQGYRSVHAAFDMILSGQMAQNQTFIMENQIKIVENL